MEYVWVLRKQKGRHAAEVSILSVHAVLACTTSCFITHTYAPCSQHCCASLLLSSSVLSQAHGQRVTQSLVGNHREVRMYDGSFECRC